MTFIQAELQSARRRWRSTRVGLAGIWLLFLYALFSTFVVLSFSAFQLQLTIQNYKEPSGKSLELWSVKNIYEKWKVDADQLKVATERYSELSGAIKDKKIVGRSFENDIFAIYENCRGEIRDYINGIYNQVIVIDGEYANILQRNIDNRNFCRTGFVTEFLNEYKTTIKERQDRRDVLAPAGSKTPSGSDKSDHASQIWALIANYKAPPIDPIIDRRLAQVKEMLKTALLNTATIDKMNNEKQKVWDEIAGFQNQITKLFADGEQRFDNVIGNYLISFSYFDDVEQMPYLGRFIPDFSKMPPDTLTLILVLAMGSLGGTIQLSRKHLAFLDADDRQAKMQPSYYLFRPFLGAITALSVFILVKAGVLVASLPTPNGESANLSPFFISFLAIVSGLLAEQALETIEQVGERFFTQSKAAPGERWAFGLMTALRGPDGTDATYEKNLKDLSSALGIVEEQIVKWANEKEPVPDSFQRIMAAFFRLPLRSLFTDIKP